MVAGANTVAPSSGLAAGSMDQPGPIDGRLHRSRCRGGVHRLDYLGANPYATALHSGFFIGEHSARPSRVRRARIPAAGEKRVAVRACSQGARCKSETIRGLAEHQSLGACELSTGIGDPERGRYPAFLPVGVGGPLGEKPRDGRA